MQNSSYQSREDRLRDLERERSLFTSGSLQYEDAEDPKWSKNKVYGQQDMYEYLYPGQHGNIPPVTFNDMTRSQVPKDNTSALKFGRSGDNTAGKSAYIDMEYSTESPQKLAKSLSEFERETRFNNNKNHSKAEKEAAEVHSVQRFVRSELNKATNARRPRDKVYYS